MHRFTLVVLVALALGALAGAGEAAGKSTFAQISDDESGLWIARGGKPLLRLDRDGRATARIDVGRSTSRLAAGLAHVWAVDERSGTLARVDPARARVEARRRLPLSAQLGLAVGRRSVWVAGMRGRGPLRETVLLRIDPETLRVRGAFHLGSVGPVLLSAGDRAVWLALYPRGRKKTFGLVAIDEAAGSLTLRRRLAGYPTGLAASGQAAWVLSETGQGNDSRLTAVAPDGTIALSRPGPLAARNVSAAAGRVWVTGDCATRRCRFFRPGVRAYDERTGVLVAGPFRSPPCRTDRRGRSSAGLAALAGGAAMLAADSGGRTDLLRYSARRGSARCVPL